jgi:hypothetical protein
LAVAPAAAQDKAKAPEKAKAAPAAADKGKAAVTPGTTKTLVENDKVKVTEVTFKPGEGGPARERPPRVVRALSDGTMERTYPDGKTEKVEWKTGQVRYFSKDTFGNKNVGKTDVVLYVVETK